MSLAAPDLSRARPRNCTDTTANSRVRSPRMKAPIRPAACSSDLRLVCERVGAQLEVQDLAGRSFAAFGVKRRSGTVGGPQSLSFPAAFRIIDPAVHPFCVESHRIGHAQDNEFPGIGQKGKQGIIPVAGGNRHIPSQPQGVELVHPVVVTGLGASRVGDSLQLWPRELIERPTLRAVLSCRRRPVERTFTLPPVEACQVSTRNDRRKCKRSEEHTSELQSPYDLVCRLLLEKKN